MPRIGGRTNKREMQRMEGKYLNWQIVGRPIEGDGIFRLAKK